MTTFIKSCIGIITCLLFTTLLMSQEQISDIEIRGVKNLSSLTGRVGFAQHNNENFMLVVNESLTIYRWENGNFIPFKTIEGGGGSVQIKDKNRSDMSIREGKYYRNANGIIQIIDIATGEIDFDSSDIDGNISFFGFAEIVDNRMYFQHEGKIRFLDFNSGELVDTDVDFERYQIGHHVLVAGDNQINNETKIINLLTNEESESTVYPSGFSYNLTLSSRIDSSFIIIDNEGSIYRLETDSDPYNTGCVLDFGTYTMEDIEDIDVRGDRLIVARYNELVDTTVNIQVLNLSSCIEEQNLSIPILGAYGGTTIADNEHFNADFTIIHINDTDFSPGGKFGHTHIVDHTINEVFKSEDMSWLDEGTAFKYRDDIYFHGGVKSLFPFGERPTARVNVVDDSSHRIDQSLRSVISIVIGYPIDGSVIFATNSIEEEILISKLSEEDRLQVLKSISLSRNHGLLDPLDIVTIDDNIYYSVLTGLYRITDSNEPLVPTEYNELFFDPINGIDSRPLEIYEDKIRFVQNNVHNSREKLHIYDTSSDELLSYDSGPLSGATFESELLGPYQFYIHNGEVAILDIRDGSNLAIQRTFFPNIYFSSANFGYFGGTNNLDEINVIDYSTNIIQTIPFDIGNYLKVFNSKDGSAYIADIADSNDQLRIRRIDSPSDIELIYEGTQQGSTTQVKFYNSKGSDIVFISFEEDDKVNVLVDDTEKTRLYSLSEDQYISDFNNGQLLFQSNTHIRIGDGEIGLIKPFQDIVTVQNDILVSPVLYQDFSDDSALFVFKEGDDSLKFVSYDLINKDLVVNVIKSDLDNYYDWLRIDENQFLLSASDSGNYGSEPWLVDLSNEEITLVSDINPGKSNSFPQNLIKTEHGIFFTATVSGINKQWFRLFGSGVTLVEAINEPKELAVFPNPTTSQIQITSSYKSLTIFSLSGHELITYNDIDESSIIGLDDLEAGMYILLASDNSGEVYMTKVIKI